MDKNIKINHRTTCRGCGSSELTCWLDLGEMPLAGGFLDADQIKNEPKIPLKVYFCRHCTLVQILDSVDPPTLFAHYFYTSSVIHSLSEHFREYAQFLKKTYLKKKNSSLFEFGSNDGVLLQYLQDLKGTVLGMDPSQNISEVARKKNLNVITDFFNTVSANKVVETYGTFDVVTGSNVFAHIDNIQEIIEAAKIIMKSEGVLSVEVHYLADLIKDFQYDTIYHEHLTYFSVTALNYLFKKNKLKIIDVIHLPMHGGAIRVIAAAEQSSHQIKSSVAQFLEQETQLGLDQVETYLRFQKHCLRHRRQLLNVLQHLKKNEKTVVGYGAPGRGTILLNYCGITKDLIEYIVDVSPLRAGKLMPGVHIPIYPLEKARRNPPDYFLILAWNYADSILAQEHALFKRGTKFIVPFPKIEVRKAANK